MVGLLGRRESEAEPERSRVVKNMPTRARQERRAGRAREGGNRREQNQKTSAYNLLEDEGAPCCFGDENERDRERRKSARELHPAETFSMCEVYGDINNLIHHLRVHLPKHIQYDIPTRKSAISIGRTVSLKTCWHA